MKLDMSRWSDDMWTEVENRMNDKTCSCRSCRSEGFYAAEPDCRFYGWNWSE